MSHRNLLLLLTAIVVSYTCHVRANRSRYGRYLTQVLDTIDDRALELVPQTDLFEGAMRGIERTLHYRGDQHSGFISARDAASFEADLNQEFGGVGVVISLESEDDELKIIAHPLLGTPAFKAGMRSGDRILRIDGVDTAGMNLDDVKRRMRGPIGEAVELTVLHESETAEVTLSVVRDTINIPSVLGDHHVDGGWDFRLEQDSRIGYLQITSFANKTVDEVDEALDELEARHVEALVIDLRGNPGGALDVAIEIADRFLTGDKTIVSVRGRGGKPQESFVSSGTGTWLDLPMAVLVDGNSASASEIVAACLQDHDRAVIVGERSYGKGTIQQVLKIESGRSILKLTTASYWRPSGKNIHRMNDDTPDDDDWGVLPNDGFVVTLTEEEKERLGEARLRALYDDGNVSVEPVPDGTPSGEASASAFARDRQLQKAVEYLQSQLD